MRRRIVLLALALPAVACVGPEPEYGTGGGGPGSATTGTTTGGPESCNVDDECGGAFSVRVCGSEGYCCDALCDDPCESCIGANTGFDDGFCKPITRGEDPKNPGCPMDQACDGDAQIPRCLGLPGASCPGFGSDCLSGVCSQGLCD